MREAVIRPLSVFNVLWILISGEGVLSVLSERLTLVVKPKVDISLSKIL